MKVTKRIMVRDDDDHDYDDDDDDDDDDNDDDDDDETLAAFVQRSSTYDAR